MADSDINNTSVDGIRGDKLNSQLSSQSFPFCMRSGGHYSENDFIVELMIA